MPRSTKHKVEKTGLGRVLIKKQQARRNKIKDSERHGEDIDDGEDWNRLNLKSVTNESNLEDFLNTASLAGTEFSAEKENVTLIESVSVAPVYQESTDAHNEEDEELLTIPRRPKWTREMKKYKLIEAEKREFLEWRRRVALVQERRNYMTTPFEKNLEFWRQIWRVVEKSNVLVQVVDARNPLLFYSKDLDKYAKEVDSSKQSVLLMNKSDFLTDKQREEWCKYFNQNNMSAFFFSAIAPEEDEDASSELNKSEESICQPNSPNILSVGKLACALYAFAMQAVDNKCPEIGYVTVGLVGYPNVGKSSTVNALLKSKKVATSATPGKTKHFQTIFLDKQFCLCDCPGLVFPNFVSTKAELIINGILPIDEMTNHVPPVNLVACSFSRKYFESFYGIRLRECEDKLESEELLNALGYLRGFMTPRGLPDHPKTARLLLKDFVNGKLLFCKSPPSIPQAEFHSLKIEERKHREMTPLERRIVIQEMSQSEFDQQFFRSDGSSMHVKGIMRPMGQLSLGSTLPPKKLNKNTKKDKSRRVYSHLDQ